MPRHMTSEQQAYQATTHISYLACPYAHNDTNVKQFRHRLVNYYTQQYLLDGKLIYSPLTHNVPLHPPETKQSWQQWAQFDKAMLARCNELIVLQADGWQQSVGVTAEIDFAASLNFPVIYVEPSPESLEACQLMAA
jgi:hypothetical protein